VTVAPIGLDRVASADMDIVGYTVPGVTISSLFSSSLKLRQFF
jgi:hypothetical protein